MNINQQNIIGIIDQMEILSPEEKREIVLALQNGEEKLFWDAVEREEKFQDQEIKKIDNEIDSIGVEIIEEQKRVDPEIKKLNREFYQLCERELEKFEDDLKKVDSDTDKKIESLIHNAENSQIDAIRANLQK